MKGIINERISDVFNHRLNYQKHLCKLGQLTRRRSTSNGINREEAIEQLKMRRQQSFFRGVVDSEQKIRKENSLIFGKLSNCGRGVRIPASLSFDTRLPNEIVRRKTQVKTDQDNLMLYYKLNKLNSFIDNKKFKKDFQSSMLIKNRISRFERDPSKDAIVPKLNRYFQLSSRSTPNHVKKDTSLNISIMEKEKPSFGNRGLSTTVSKLSSNQGSKMDGMYKREDIIKNKVSNKWCYIKRKKFQTVTKEPVYSQNLKQSKQVGSKDVVFPTQTPSNV